MPLKIKVRCNGPNHHVNEVDVDDLVRATHTVRFAGPDPESPYPLDIADRSVLRCVSCTEGKVVITREMIEKARGSGTR